ncbi:MAG: hypothetical protein QW587_09440 [Candidatus Bathyarchaeia archaeon]
MDVTSEEVGEGRRLKPPDVAPTPRPIRRVAQAIHLQDMVDGHEAVDSALPELEGDLTGLHP